MYCLVEIVNLKVSTAVLFLNSSAASHECVASGQGIDTLVRIGVGYAASILVK
jgi:hypothetical protein